LAGTQHVVDWLLDGAPGIGMPEDVMGELCRRLQGTGLPLSRAALFVATPHPLLLGTAYFWTPDGPVEVSPAPLSRLGDEDFISSMPLRVMRTGQAIRRRLLDPDCPRDFPVLQEFAERGITDYLIAPLRFRSGEVQAVSWSASAPDGFSKTHVRLLGVIHRPLARVVEVMALRRLSQTLLDTYVGHHAGERVLAGAIHRGDVERIRAVILLADLRDFTALSNSSPPAAVIERINGFFDAAVPAIERERGEVLKFIGDGLLAIFPCEAGSPGPTCRAALRSALAISAAVRDPSLQPDMPLGCGIALHVGEVLYGNVGAGHRLDFTAIGPAVNMAARLEKLAGELGLPLLTSAEFADAAEGLVRVGSYPLKGFAQPESVYTLAGTQVWGSGLPEPLSRSAHRR
jgi:adenylate cyclase